MNFEDFSLKEEIAKCKTMDDVCGKNGLLQRLLGDVVEQMLEKEMEEHLGYKKYSNKGDNSGNSRNGKISKKLQSSFVPLEIEVPRDRNSQYEPRVVKKRQNNISSFDDKIISMYARGMTTRDIQDHVQEIYGAEISPTMVSSITDKIIKAAKEWKNRTLQRIYPITYFDAIHYKIRQKGKIVTKAAYTCLGIDIEGKKEILGLWIGESEGAKFWLQVFT